MQELDQGRHGRVRRRNLLAIAAQRAPALAERLPEGFKGRWTRRHWAHASLFATCGALLFALVPGFDHALASAPGSQRASFLLPLPQLQSNRSGNGDRWQTVTLKAGQSLSSVFDELDIPQRELVRVARQPTLQPMLRRLRPGTEIAFNLPADGSVRGMRIDNSNGESAEYEFGADAVRERAIPHETSTRTVVLSGEVGKSLFASARKLGLGSAQLRQLTDEMFKYDIDFDSDLDQNDRFSVVVDQTWRDGQLASTGPVLAATFTVDGKLKSAFRYVRDGRAEYFTPDGRSLKRPFIRMPIPYARITSGFGMRKHPILGRMRGHMGIDYAAGVGTPIMAAGDARVAFVGWKGGYGRAVILDHGGGRTTLYGHMSRFGSERVGQRVAQGAVIGYVGMSGLATGPHLHYEFRVNGVHQNPLKMTMPPPAPLSGAELAAFKGETRRALDKIREVENVVFQDDDIRVASSGKPAKSAGKG
jgi:murein DD-endopeptidase MepM/ murein hydrolase activator NlpD